MGKIVSTKHLDQKTKWQIGIFLAAVLVALGLVLADVVFKGPLTTLLSNRDEVVRMIHDAGVFGPAIFIGLQILQTVIAPIPGNVVGFVGGYVFGGMGVLWTVIGSVIGFFLVLYASRKLGRPFVEKIVKKESLEKFDFLLTRGGEFAFFLIFLIPGLPDDVVCYIAGLTKIPIPRLMALVVLGRLPTMVVTNYMGMGLSNESYWPLLIVSFLVVALLVLLWVFRVRVMNFVKAHLKEERVEKIERAEAKFEAGKEKVVKPIKKVSASAKRGATKVSGRAKKVKVKVKEKRQAKKDSDRGQ